MFDADNFYDFGHYDYMIDEELADKHQAWVTAINERERQQLPDFVLADLVVTSGYRNPHHNQYHAGSERPHSLHQYGLALDVRGMDVNGDDTNDSVDRELMRKAARAADPPAAWTNVYPISKHVHADWRVYPWPPTNPIPPAPTLTLPPQSTDGASEGFSTDDDNAPPAPPAPSEPPPEPQLCNVTYADYMNFEDPFCQNDGSDGCATGMWNCGSFVGNCCCADTSAMHPCGVHPRTASGIHSFVTSCILYSGALCNADGYYACQPHTHGTTPVCGNTASGANACSARRISRTATEHQRTCRAGHRYWICDRTAVAAHRRHQASDSSSNLGSGSGSSTSSGSSSASSSTR